MKKQLLTFVIILSITIAATTSKAQNIFNTAGKNLSGADSSAWFRKGPYCADVQSLAMAPSNPDVLYLGTLATGIYKTTNGGENWTLCSTENLPAFEDTISNSRLTYSWWHGDYYPINAIAIDPEDENHLWASSLEKGLLESTNGGDSWQQANETLPDTLSVHFININPSDPDDILLGSVSGDAGNGGLYRTIDGGTTWAIIDSVPHGESCHITDIVRDPADNDHIMIGVSSSFDPDFPWGIMESYDNGYTWQEVIDVMRFSNLNINPNNQQNVWGIAYTGWGDLWLMFSIDGGQSWELYEDFENPYLWVLSMYADADFNLYIERQTESHSHSILKSEDKGETWFEVDNLTDKPDNVNYTINLTNKCQAEPADTDNVYFGTYYGVYHSDDGGNTTQFNNYGLMNSYIHDLEVHPFNKDIVYASSFQGVWKSTNACRSWEKVIDMQVADVRFNQLFPDTLYYLGIHPMRSYDGGITFENIRNNIQYTITGLAINPVYTNVVFISTGSILYRSLDYGDSWAVVFESAGYEFESNIIFDPSEPNNIYWGKNRSTDMGSTWEYSVFDKNINAVHPQNSDILYGSSTTGNGHGNDIHVSYDGGQSFQLLTIYLDGISQKNNIKNFTISKDDPDHMFFCTTNDGIHYSTDAGENWQQLEGTYEKRTMDVIPLVNEDKYYVASHGDGVWVHDPTYVSVPVQSTPLSGSIHLTVAPNPFKGQTTIYYETNIAAHTNVSIYDLQGKRITTLVDEHKPKGGHKIKWNGIDQKGKEVIPGIYTVCVQSGKRTNSCKIVLFK